MDNPVATGKTLQELLKGAFLPREVLFPHHGTDSGVLCIFTVVKAQRPEDGTLLHDIRKAMETFEDPEITALSDAEIFAALENIETLANSLARGVVPQPRQEEDEEMAESTVGKKLQVRGSREEAFAPFFLSEVLFSATVR